ncbi:hypothetical protein B296_00000029 [Ensete ventricosum]|uniref:Uncharacterized protein n=1 Tax=Ensete ventricosum TaxID=4639 RepID=A0A427AM76_ENSVE|nr:hypothetical protein B296_00000029 [Ensete ventricosum]
MLHGERSKDPHLHLLKWEVETPQADGRPMALVMLSLTPKVAPSLKASQRQAAAASLTTFLRAEQHCACGLSSVLPISTKVRQSARERSAEEQSMEGAGALTFGNAGGEGVGVGEGLGGGVATVGGGAVIGDDGGVFGGGVAIGAGGGVDGDAAGGGVEGGLGGVPGGELAGGVAGVGVTGPGDGGGDVDGSGDSVDKAGRREARVAFTGAPRADAFNTSQRHSGTRLLVPVQVTAEAEVVRVSPQRTRINDKSSMTLCQALGSSAQRLQVSTGPESKSQNQLWGFGPFGSLLLGCSPSTNTGARAHTPEHISLLPAVNAKQKELLTKFPPLSILLLAVLLNHYKRGAEKPTTTHPFPLRSLPTVATSSVP